MNEVELKSLEAFLGIFNKAKFENVTTMEMLQMTKKFDAVGRLILRYRALLNPKVIEPKTNLKPKSKVKGKKK